MAFPQSFMDELVARNPVDEVVSQYVTLEKKGSSYFGLCPFHSEKTGSFHVDPNKGICYCFGCHKGGGVVNFIMEIENLDFPDAVRFLAKRAGMEVPEDRNYESTYKKQERLWALCKDAARFYYKKLNEPCGEEARAYMEKRGISKAIATRFGLGYAPDEWTGLLMEMTKLGYEKQELLEAGLALKHREKGTLYDRFRNRLIFPIIDIRGNIIGFGGRVMGEGEPKYLNSPETLIFNKRKNLFAMNLVKKSKQGRIILTEGYMDAMSLHQYGFDCAVASLGTALTEEQAQLMSKYTEEVVLTYDGDEAGQNATKRAIPILEKAGLRVKVLKMQGAKDPDEYLKKYGAERFRLLLEGSTGQMDYRLQSLESGYNLLKDEDRLEYLKKAADLIASLQSPVERDIYISKVAETAGVSKEALKLEAENAYKRRARSEKRREERRAMRPVENFQPAQRSIRYENMKSAMAEENILRMVCIDESLFSLLESLSGENFSSELLGRAFEALRDQYRSGNAVSFGPLAGEFTKEEMQHLMSVINREGFSTVSEDGLMDCVRIIEDARARGQEAGDLLAARARLLQKKGGFGQE